jgi:hypothetical protein
MNKDYLLLFFTQLKIIEMKRFISTKFFFSLKEVSQTGIDIDAQVLENGYDEFAILLFSEYAAFTDKSAYYNTLVYTRIELISLVGVSGEKYGCIPEKSH